VHDDVEALAAAALLDLAPREHDGPLLVRLARQHVVARVHDAVLVLVGAIAYHELVGMDDDRLEQAIGVEAELEDRQTGHRGDSHALRLVERHAARSLELLFVQEQEHQRAQPSQLLRRQPRERGHGGYGRRPLLLGNRVALQDAPSPPAFEHAANANAAADEPPGPSGRRVRTSCRP
jgi:hypothetical protein